MNSEIVTAICEIAEIFDNNQIAYLVGGSFSSSVHGLFRTTNDIDILVDGVFKEKSAVVSALESKFLVDARSLVENLSIGRSYNIFHQLSAIKFDLFPAKIPFHRSELERAIDLSLPIALRSFKVATAEDIIIAKLLWSKNSLSERQRGDILGVLKTSAQTLDWTYLNKWAEITGTQNALMELSSVASKI